MKTETLEKITQELKADGYKLESMIFRNAKSGEVTLWIDGNDDEDEDRIKELQNKCRAAYDEGNITDAMGLSDEIVKLKEKK